MGVKNLTIILDNSPPGGYQPGATVNGRIIVSSNERIHIRSLSVKVQGEACVSFTDIVTRRRRRFRRFRSNEISTQPDLAIEETTSQDIERFSAEEKYYTTTYQLLGETEMSIGEQEYLFTTILPAVLPSTFTGQHGYIRYTLRVKLDKAWNFDEVAKVEFRVTAPKDLNLIQSAVISNHTLHGLSEPLVYRGVKSFNCLCCKSGPLAVVVQLAKSGVVPGEQLQITIEVDNTTDVNISSINIILKQETVWLARVPRNNSKRTVEELVLVRCDGVQIHDNRTWRQPFTIPPMSYINIDACSIIKLYHFIVVEAVADGLHKNLTVVAPIVIGTVPIGAGVRKEMSYGMPCTAPEPCRDIGFLQQQRSRDIGFVSPTSPVEPPPPYPGTPQPMSFPMPPTK